MKPPDEDLSTVLIGCLTPLLVGGFWLAVCLGALWAATRVVRHAWGAS